jgi:hypothetical protein
MAQRTIEERVAGLELTVNGLQRLPAAVATLVDRVGSLETQVSQLRVDMQAEFSAMRAEMVTRSDLGHFAKKEDLKAFPTRDEMREDFAAARDDLLRGLGDVKQELGTQIAAAKRDLKEQIGGAKRDLEEQIGGLREELGSQIHALDSRVDGNTALLKEVLLRLPPSRAGRRRR